MFQVEECPEIWVDACLRNSEGRLLFMSLYGRDSSVMQFMSALELGASHEHGLDRFHLVQSAAGVRHPVEVQGTQRLNKHSGRLPRQVLFGPMAQVWLFDKALQHPDRANGIAWVLHRGVEGEPPALLENRVWATLVDLAPVALLPHWREPVMQWCQDKRAVSALQDDVYPVLGAVSAVRISLSTHFVSFISEGVRNGLLKP